MLVVGTPLLKDAAVVAVGTFTVYIGLASVTSHAAVRTTRCHVY